MFVSVGEGLSGTLRPLRGRGALPRVGWSRVIAVTADRRVALGLAPGSAGRRSRCFILAAGTCSRSADCVSRPALHEAGSMFISEIPIFRARACFLRYREAGPSLRAAS
jgi:hypothetical protein